MLFYTGLVFLVIAVSLDGFGVGVTYGMRKIHIPFIALIIIMFCSGCIVFLSMTIGNTLSTFISAHLAKIFGGSILIALGIFSFMNLIRPQLSSTENELQMKKDKKRHFLTSILKTPDKADLDRSGIISVNEAFLLGAALALDAFGAGIGASMLGYSPLLTTILVASMSGLFVYSGIHIGFILSKSKQLQHLTFIPPVLLITLGIMNLF